MYNKLKNIEGVTLQPKEVVGPALVGSVEYFNGEKSTYHGSLVATTQRLFLNLEDHGVVCIEDFGYDKITRITIEDLLLVGKIVHLWTDDQLIVSVKSISEGSVDKFMEFVHKYKGKFTLEKEALA